MIEALSTAVALLYVWLISVGGRTVRDGLRHLVDRVDRRGELAGGMLLRTDRSGWIELNTDGQQMWVAVREKATEKASP